MENDFRLRLTVLLALLAMLFCATFAMAQGIVTGTISGTVLDPQGAVVSGAKVTATHVATNRTFTADTTAAGIFTVRALPPGAYQVKVEAPNFRTFQSTGVTVSANSDTSLGSVKMEIGSASETLTVEGAAPIIETTTTQITNTYDSKATESLPIGSNFDTLALFLPGVSTAGDAGFSNTNGEALAVNGQRGRSNNFQIDGQNNNDNSIGGPSIFFGNQDAISELQVITNYTAEYGRNMGAVVNYITKSGTNQFHGSGYEFWQGSKFDSLQNQEKSPLFNGPDGLPFCAPGQTTGCDHPTVPQFVENRFGGTIGGPIVKDRAWFFGSTNWDRIRTGGLPSSSSPGLLPTPTGLQQLAAAFPNSPAAPLLTEIGPSAVKLGNPVYSNLQNILVSDQIDPTTGAAVDCVTSLVGCVPIQFGEVSRFVPSPFNDREFTGRVDLKLTNKDNFFGRYVFQQQIQTGVNFGLGTDVGDFQSTPGRDQQIGLDWTRNFTTNFVNQVRFSYSRANFFFEEQSFPQCNDKSPTSCPPEILMLGSANQDIVSFGVAAGFPQGRIINVYQLQDNASFVKGRHFLKIGGEYDKQRSPNVFLPNNNGVYFFGSFNDLAANNPLVTRLTVGDPHLPFKEKDLAFYVQDDWRVRDNLTLNLGLRWEWFQQAINLLHDRSVAQQTGPNPFWDTALPLSQTTVPRVPQDTNNFGPVVGFAWTPRGGIFQGDKTVIRGGFRISYDPEFYNIFLNVATSAPSVNAAQFAGPLPTTGPYTGSALASFLAPFLPTGVNPGIRNHTIVSPKFHNPYSEQWTFGVQQSITPRVVAEVRYVGNHTVGNFQSFNGNPALQPLIDGGFANLIPPGLTPCTDPTQPGSNAGYANCNFRRVVERANSAFSNYNALQSELRIGGWHNLSASAGYTWSHTIDNASEIFSTIGSGNTLSFPQNPFNTNSAERANSGIDFPNVFGLSLVYEIPFAKSQKGFVGHALGGWQLNTTYRFTSGQPYTTIQKHHSDFCDPTSTLSGTYDACRPILQSLSAPLDSVGMCTNPAVPDCGISDFVTGAPTTLSAVHWILNDDNAAEFFGSPFKGVGRNTLRGQRISTANLGIFKNTKVSERVTLQFQAQAFNVFNHMFLGSPSPVLDNVTAGAFQNTHFNFDGGGNNLDASGGTFSSSQVYDGIGRRRLLFGMKVIF